MQRTGLFSNHLGCSTLHVPTYPIYFNWLRVYQSRSCLNHLKERVYSTKNYSVIIRVLSLFFFFYLIYSKVFRFYLFIKIERVNILITIFIKRINKTPSCVHSTSFFKQFYHTNKGFLLEFTF